MHADDTTTTSSRTSIEGVGRRAQQAADVVTACAARLKNGSQGRRRRPLSCPRWMRDTTGLSGKVAGIQVATYTSVSLMEVTFVLLLLHRGTQCAELRRKVVQIAPAVKYDWQELWSE